MSITIKVFVSSPGDVSQERFLAERVLRQLQNAYRHLVKLEPIFWEHEPLTASQSFQEGLISPRETDIVVCILWSRLGTRLPLHVTRGENLTGTEYEFVEALEGKKEKGTPDLLVYRKTAKPLMDLSDRQRRSESLWQMEALEAFFERWFCDDQQALIAAFHLFERADEFEEHLEHHLRKLLEQRLKQLGMVLHDGGLLVPTWTQGSPFRGLNLFEYEHHGIFFGRTKAISDVVDQLKRQAEQGRAFVLVSGASGCGKSSLVRAGVFPTLAQPGVIEGVGLCRYAIIRPSDVLGDLFGAVVAALLRGHALPELTNDGTTPLQLAASLQANPKGIAPLLKGAISQAAATMLPAMEGAVQPSARFLLLVDQIEELFTLDTIPQAQRQAFAVLIHTLAHDPLARTFVVATLRSDFYAAFVAVPEFAELKEGLGHYDLLPPTANELTQLIREPARAGGTRFEQSPEGERLDDVLRDEAVQDASVLPLVEFLLAELYERRNDRGELTFAAYRELGGVKGALALRAESVFQALPEAVQQELSPVFRQLVTIGTLSDERATRRQVPLAVFAHSPTRRAFVNGMIEARLFVSDDTTAGPVVRLTHEALLTHWERVQQWLQSDRELLLVKARLETCTTRWDYEKRRTDLLLPAGKPLQEAEQLLAAGVDLDPATAQLIVASRARAGRLRRLRQGAVLALSVLLVAATVFAVYAWTQHGRASRLAEANGILAQQQASLAQQNGELAQQRGQLALANGTLAEKNLQFGLANKKLADDRQAALESERAQRVQLEWQLHSSTVERVRRLGQEGDGPQALKLLQSVAPDKQGWETAYLGNYFFGQQQVFRTDGRVEQAAFSPDGRYLLVKQAGGYSAPRADVRRFDTATGLEVNSFPTAGFQFRALAYSPDGQWFLTVDENLGAVVYDVATGKERRRFGSKCNMAKAALSPDGRWLATGDSKGTVRVWEVAEGQERQQLSTTDIFEVRSLAFASDSELLAVGYISGIGRVWNTTTGKPLTLLGQTGPSINGIAWATDYEAIWGACDNGLVKKWNAINGKELRSQYTHNGSAVLSITFNHTGDFFATSGADQSVIIWKTSTEQALFGTLSYGGQARQIAFSPGGRRLAIPGSNGVRVWELVAGDRIEKLPHRASTVNFSPNSNLIAVAGSSSDGGELTVYHRHTLQRLLRLRMPTDSNDPFEVNFTAFTPDSERIWISRRMPATLECYDVRTGERVHRWAEPQHSLAGIALSPDGCTMLTAQMPTRTSRTEYTLREPTTGAVRKTLLMRSGLTLSDTVAFAPSGRYCSIDVPGRVLVYDVADGREVAVFSASDRYLTTSAFTPDSQGIVVLSSDGSTRRWDIASKTVRADFMLPAASETLAFTPDSKQLLFRDTTGLVRFCEPQLGQPLFDLKIGGKSRTYAISPDGLSVALATQDTLAGALRVFNIGPRPGITVRDFRASSARPMAVTPTAKHIASVGRDQKVRVWERASGREIYTTPDATYTACALLPDGDAIVLATTTGILRVYDLVAGQITAEWVGHEGEIRTVVVAANSQRIATASTSARTINVWNRDGTLVKAYKKLTFFANQQPANPQGVVPIPPSIDSAEEFSRTPSVSLFHLALRGDGRQLALGGFSSQPGELYLLDIDDDKETRLHGHSSVVVCLAYSPDGQRLLSAEREAFEGNWPSVLVWDTTRGEEVARLRGHRGSVTAAQFAADGRTIATLSLDHTLRLWDGTTGQTTAVYYGLHETPATTLAFTSNTQLVSVHRDGTAHIWETATLQSRTPDVSTLVDLALSATAFAARFPSAEATTLRLQSLAYLRQAGQREPQNIVVRAEMATVLETLATAAILQGDATGSAKYLQEMHTLHQNMLREAPLSPERLAMVAGSERRLAAIYAQQLQFGPAITQQAEAVARYRQFATLADVTLEPQRWSILYRMERDLELYRLGQRASTDLKFALQQDAGVVPQLLGFHADHVAKTGQHATLAELGQVLADRYPFEQIQQYNAACYYGRALKLLVNGRPEETLATDQQQLATSYKQRAFELLGRSFQLGYNDISHLKDDSDIDGLRTDARYKTILLGRGAELAAPPAMTGDFLRYKYKEGEVRRYRVEANMTIEGRRGANKPGRVNSTIAFEASFRVQAAKPDGSAQLVACVDRVQMTVRDFNDNEVFAFDTKDAKLPAVPDQRAMAQLFVDMVGIEIEVSMDEWGHASPVKIPAQFAQFRNRLPASMASMTDQFTDEGLQKMVGLDSLPRLPNAALVEGVSWTGPVDRNMINFGVLSSQIRYAYMGTEEYMGRTMDKLRGTQAFRFTVDPKATV
jgi:WD40 repeat protein